MNYFLIRNIDISEDVTVKLTIEKMSYDDESGIFSLVINAKEYKFKIDSNYGEICIIEQKNNIGGVVSYLFFSEFEQFGKNKEYVENYNLSDIVKKERFLNSTNEYITRYILSVYKTSNGDILIYPNVVDGSIVYGKEFTNIQYVTIEENMFLGDYILQTYGEDEKFIFRKCVSQVKNNSLFFEYKKWLSYKRLYLDFECDFLMNYIKFLCEKNDESVVEFLNLNPKYRLIYNIAINEDNDILSNELYTDDVIRTEFEYKTLSQKLANKHKENYDKINNATTIEELQNII